MTSAYETFWTHGSYAVVGHSSKKPFPKLTYQGLKERGKQVFPVDPSAQEVDGDPTFGSLADLPGAVQAVVLEVPREETADWVSRAADAGIEHVWIHMNRETPEALAIARERGLDLRYGTCAVMYLKGGFHKMHKWIMKWRGRY